MRVTVDLDSTDILEDINLQDLVDALKRRLKRTSGQIALDVSGAIDLLDVAGLPKELISQLRDWDDTPIPTKERLEQWRRFCQASPATAVGSNLEGGIPETKR